MSIAAGVGNVAHDPFITKNPQGEITSARFTLVEDVWTKQGKKVTYIDCIAFGRIAEIVNLLLKKGTQVYFEGSFLSGEYQKDGKTIYTRFVRVNRVQLPSGTARPESSASTESTDSAEPEKERPYEEFEELPFSMDEEEYRYYDE